MRRPRKPAKPDLNVGLKPYKKLRFPQAGGQCAICGVPVFYVERIGWLHLEWPDNYRFHFAEWGEFAWG